ncbi:MAG: phytanoyl-CoA dioxygenase family protein [Ignavibacteriota bacterium]
MIKFNELSTESADKILRSQVSASLIEFLHSALSLSKEQVNYYNDFGFVKIENVIEKDFLPEVNKIIESSVLLRKGKDERELKDKSQYEQSLLQCGYLCWDFPAVKEFVFAKRFAGIVRDLMQADHVRLWHDQALFKEPGGRITDAHQDCSYWPIAEPEFTATMWIALTDVPVEKGCLYFYPRTNDSNLKEYVDIFKNPHQPNILTDKEKIFVPLKAGDATFHSGLTFHGAGNNQTSEMREAMTIIYIKDDVTFDASDERNKTHTSCVGLKDGEIINTRYTPILI